MGLNARVIRDKENERVIIEEINHGYLNDGYDDFLYEDEGICFIAFDILETGVFGHIKM